MNDYYGVFSVDIPMPFRPNQVNCFIGEGENGWVVIDTGLDRNETFAVWQRALDELNLTFKDIQTVFLTHRHPDHIGFAGRMQQLSGAVMYLSAEDYESVQQTLRPDAAQRRVRFLEIFHVRPDTIRMMEETSAELALSPDPDIIPIEADGEIKIGDLTYSMIPTPGHSDGHIALYNNREKVLFIGDHVLPNMSPTVSLTYVSSGNPLKRYLDSLAELKELEVDLAIPSHGEPFTNWREQIEQIIRHYEDRSDAIHRALLHHRDAESITRHIFGDRLNRYNITPALCGVLSHLRYLESLGRAMEDNGFFYRA